MEEDTYFKLSFDEKFQYICMIRQKLYDAATKEERDNAIPTWVIKMVKDFEERYAFREFSALFLGSFLMMTGYEDNEEIVYILDEINENQLHLTILELEAIIGFSWNNLLSEDESALE